MPAKMTFEESKARFWEQVSIGGPDTCWEWCGSITGSGYGSMQWRGKVQGAHRIAWMLTYSHRIPDGLDVCHECDNKRCCNPRHLWLGTRRENLADMHEKGRGMKGKTHWSTRMPDRVPSGTRHWASELSPRQVSTIKRRYAAGRVTQQDLADEFGVSQTHISRIVRGVAWKGLLPIERTKKKATKRK